MKSDSARITTMLDMSAKLSADSAITVARRAIEMSNAAQFPYGCFLAWQVIALRDMEKNDFAAAQNAFETQAPLSRTNAQRAGCYANVGFVHIRQGDYMGASKRFYLALQMLDNDTSKRANVNRLNIYNGLAVVNEHLNQDGKNIYYQRLGEQIARQGKLYVQLSTILVNMAGFYRQHHKLDSATSYVKAADTIYNFIKDPNLKIGMLSMLGDISHDSEQYERSIAYYRQALILVNKVHDDRYNYCITSLSYAIGNDLYLLGKYKQAEEEIQIALKNARAVNDMHDVVFAYGTLANIYEATGRYRQALESKDSAISIGDSLTGIEKARIIDQMDAEYKTAEKDEQIARNELIITQQKNKIASRNILMLSTAGGTLLLLLGAIIIYLQMHHRQKTAERDSKILLLKATMAGSEQERSRIARELHDGIGGMLGAAMMRFSTMHHENETITETEAYNDAMKILGEMGDEIRKSAHNLMPDVLLKQSLPDAIRTYCNSVKDDKLKIDFQSYGTFSDLDQMHKLHLYRIVQELIINAIKHAAATAIMVQLLRNSNKLILSVEDNGQGLNADEGNRGIGLENISNRVNVMDGYLTIESAPGKGMAVIVEVDTVN